MKQISLGKTVNALITLCLLQGVSAQSLLWLGKANFHRSIAYDVSADGTVVVGLAKIHNNRHAFMWTAQTGITILGSGAAYGVSADGRTVVGIHRGKAFRWSQETDFEYVAEGSFIAIAYDVSADGEVIAGMIDHQAFAWKRSANPQLRILDLYFYESEATGVSSNGEVFVGWAGNRQSQEFYAFRWTFRGGGHISYMADVRDAAVSVSGDGSTIVGWWGSMMAPEFEQLACFWMRTPLGRWESTQIAGPQSVARSTTYDGSVIVGWVQRSQEEMHAFRWSASTRCQDLNQVYRSLLSGNSRLYSANAISLDGRYIVGYGRNGRTGREEAYLLDTWRRGDTNGDGCINETDLLAVLNAYGSSGTALTRHEDIDKSGTVDDGDLLILLFNFGQGC